MITPEYSDSQYKEKSTEILFLKKELDFLLKILRNCYSTAINLEKTKLLDDYWKEFEQIMGKLEVLHNKICLEENVMTLSRKNLPDAGTGFGERHLLDALKSINEEIKTLKESFYEFMHGCNACAYKIN